MLKPKSQHDRFCVHCVKALWRASRLVEAGAESRSQPRDARRPGSQGGFVASSCPHAVFGAGQIFIHIPPRACAFPVSQL